jgi:hypothetical protein
MNRLRHSGRLAVGILGFLTTLAVAFFIGTYLGEGTHTGTVGSGGTGSQTLPVSVSWPEGELSPTKPVTLTAKLNNTSGKTVTMHHVSFVVASNTSGCEASWFEVKAIKTSESGSEVTVWESILAGQEAALTYAPGERNVVTNAATGLQLKMKDTGASQSACEGASITVTGKLS